MAAGRPLGVDLDGLLPVLAQGVVVQAGVNRRHLRGHVVQQRLHDRLRDVGVDQPGAQGVPELVEGDPDRPSEFVDQAELFQPCLQVVLEAGGAGVLAAVDVAVDRWEQPRRADRESLQHGLPLGEDLAGQVLGEWEERRAVMHLAVDPG